MNTKDLPLWQRNFQLYSKSYPIIQLSSCIQDLVPLRNAIGTSLNFVPLDEWIWKTFSAQLNNVIVFYSALNGFSNRFSSEHLNEFNRLGGRGNANEFPDACQCILHAFQQSQDKKVIVVFDASIRWLTAGPIIQPNDQRAFTSLKSAIVSANGPIRHRLVFINEKSRWNIFRYAKFNK